MMARKVILAFLIAIVTRCACARIRDPELPVRPTAGQNSI
jgi:hypothetical protein